MGKKYKYIIELEEPEIFDEQKFYTCTQMPWWAVSENIVENLTPYTVPDLEQVRKEAYKKGREAGIKDGMCEAWEAARKIVLDKEDGGLDTVAYCEIFGYGKGFRTVMKTFSASEVIEKLKAYEQEQDAEFKVGDEVFSTGGKAVVVKTNKDFVYYVYDDGTWGFNPFEEVTKTGRHFDEIAAVLEKMKKSCPQ